MCDPALCPKLSIIIPTLNEEQNIDPLLTGLLRTYEGQLDQIEILIADGGSTDTTKQQVDAWNDRAPVRFVAASSGRGLSGDVLVAAHRARGSVVVVMDADLSHDPDSVPALVEPILADEADMVIGSRYIPGGSSPDWPLTRKLMSRLAALVTWPLVDVRDPTSGFFAVKREHLLAVSDDADGFKIGLEIMLSADDDFRVSESPITFRDRTLGSSKMSVQQISLFFRRTFHLAGGTTSASNARRFAVVGLVGLVVDMTIFQIMWSTGAGLAAAHITSFAVATVVNYVLNSRWAFRSSADSSPHWHAYTRYIIICLLALFLRGGVLTTLVEQFGIPVTLSLVLAIVAAAGVNYLGCAFFVFPSIRARSANLRWNVAAAGLIVYSILLRLVYIGLPNLIPEEAYYWNYAMHPSLSYLDHPPMVAWLINIGTQIFGNSETGVRIGMLFCWVLTLVFSFGLARNLFNKAVAIRTTLLVAVLPFFFFTSIIATPDAPLAACWAGALYFLERALLGKSRWAWIGVGVFTGLGLDSKYTIALLGAATLTFILTDRQSRRWLLRPQPYIAAAIALLLFTPVLLWNYSNDWASFAFQSTRRLQDESGEFALHLLIGSIIVLLTPIGLVAAGASMFGALSKNCGTPQHEPYALRRRRFIQIFTLVPLSVFVLFSIFHQPKLNWTGPLWLAVLPAIAARMPQNLTLHRGVVSSVALRLWIFTFVSILLFFGGTLHYLAIGLPFIRYPAWSGLPLGWEELGASVEVLEDQYELELGEDPIVVGLDRYQLASELAFYRRHTDEGWQETSSRHLVGGDALMYEHWFPSENYAGRSLLLISLHRAQLEGVDAAKWFKTVGPILFQDVFKEGKLIGRYFYRLCQNYKPQTTN
jgi:dolichol-phosphate mannosyltransferase